MPSSTLKQAIQKEQNESLTPAIVAEQLQIIQNAKVARKKDIENIFHSKSGPGFKASDIKAYQDLAVFRINKGLPVFPFKLKLNPGRIPHPFY